MSEARRHRAWCALLSVLIALDLVLLVAGQLMMTRGEGLDPEAGVDFVMGRSLVGHLCLAGLGLAGLWRFHRQGAGMLNALLVAVSLGVLLLSHIPLVVGFHGHYLHASAALLGWCGGYGISRAWFNTSSPAAWRSTAYLCSVTVIAGTAFNAGLAKLVGFGTGALDTWLIRLSLVMDHHVDTLETSGALWQSVLASEALSSAVGLGLLVAELGAPMMVFGGRLARVWAAVLLAYNAVMGVLFGMFFWEGMVMLLFVVVLPPASASLGLNPIPRKVPGFLGVVGVLGLLTLGLPLTAPKSGTAGEPPSTTKRVVPGVEVSGFGPIVTGEELPGSWTVSGILTWVDSARFVLRDPQGRILTLDARVDSQQTQLVQFSAGRIRLHYRTQIVEPGAFQAAAKHLLERLDRADRAEGGGRFETWLDAPGQ